MLTLSALLNEPFYYFLEWYSLSISNTVVKCPRPRVLLQPFLCLCTLRFFSLCLLGIAVYLLRKYPDYKMIVSSKHKWKLGSEFSFYAKIESGLVCLFGENGIWLHLKWNVLITPSTTSFHKSLAVTSKKNAHSLTKPFYHIKASKSCDRWISCYSETSTGGIRYSKIAKSYVGNPLFQCKLKCIPFNLIKHVHRFRGR